MGRTATIVWSVIGILAFFVFVFCAFCSVVMGFACLAGAPHAFGPSPGAAAVFFLFAVLFVALAAFVLRRSVRGLRTGRQM